MTDKDFYREVKPILNRLGGHNLFQNLYAIRYYMRKSFKSISSDKDNPYRIEKPNECTIPPYLADFLIINSIKYSNNSSNQSLWTYKERYKVIASLNKISNKVSDLPNRDDVFSWLKSFIFNQEKMQLGEDIRAILYRYYYLYSNVGTDEIAYKLYNTFFDGYYSMSLILFMKFEEQFAYTIDELCNCFSNKTSCGKREFVKLIYSLSTTIKELKDYYCSTSDLYSSEKIFYAYMDDLHILKPLIINEGIVYCVNPNYLLKALLGKIYYELDETKHREIGKVYESYIESQFLHYLNTNDSFSGYKREFEYETKKESKRTSDFIVWSHEMIAFIDCKMKKLKEISKRTQYLDNEFIQRVLLSNWYSRKEWENNIARNSDVNDYTKDVLELAKGIGKIYRCYDSLLNKEFELCVNDHTKQFKAILLTHESVHVGLNYPIIAEIAQWYRCKGKPNKNISCSFQDISIISASDFDSIVPYIGQDGIDRFIKGLIWCNDDRSTNKLENEYLGEKFYKLITNEIKNALT